MCEQQYFMEYVLGWRGDSNKKADKGTIVHKVLEILAFIKLAQQNKQDTIDDDVIGEVSTSEYSLNTIIEKVYNYYSSNFKHHTWEIKDYKDCHKWCYKAIEYENGMFDPRNRHIVCPEQRFDLIIDKPWSKYSYETKDGPLQGNLAIKGTIDLITQPSENTLEIVDWKTGRRLDWATGQEKTQEKLENDPQLKIYYYAIKQLYPDIDHVIVTIYFINDGGPFSVCFENKDLYETESMLRKKFEHIKRCEVPKLSKSWKCSKLCHFGKNSFQNTHLPILDEYRSGQLADVGQPMTMCEQIKHDVQLTGMKEVVDKYTLPGYTVGKYKAPGSTE